MVRFHYPELYNVGMESQICKTCGSDKPVSAFERTASGWRRECKDCRRSYYSKLYADDPDRRLQIKKSNRQRVVENLQKLWRYLESHPCVDCGESDPVVLEFDHVRGEKVKSVSVLAAKNNWECVESEIAKCEVRCANCHRRRTAKSLGWYRGVV